MRKRLLIYLSVFLGSLAISIDFASIDLALPSLERQYGLDLEQVQWVINGYVIAFAVFMVSGGKLADAYGRKRIFQIGMALFGLASLVGGLAWSGGAVIAFRVFQGLGAALLWPAMIGLSCAAVGEKNRGFALGLVLGTCSIGNSAGPVVGGALTQWLDWRWILWINVPIAVLTMVITARAVPADEPAGAPPKNDFLGMSLLSGGLIALMIAVYQVDSWGWASAKFLGLFAVALVLLGAFPVVEHRVSDPLVPPELMRNREFISLCLAAMGICQVFFIVLLYFTQYAMKFHGDSPMSAGACVVPFMLSYGVISYLGGPLYAHIGARRLLVVGLLATIVATALLAAGGMDRQGWLFNSLLILLGIGVGAVIPTVNTRAIETAGIARASLTGGVTFMFQLAGATLVLALATALFTTGSHHALDQRLTQDRLTLGPAQQQTVATILSGAKTIHTLVKTPVLDSGPLRTAVTAAYQSGLQLALWASASLLVLILLLVLRYVVPPNTPHSA
ncbi:MAG: MFS transporter [Opitutales bacterium]|jgi:MFS family permease